MNNKTLLILFLLGISINSLYAQKNISDSLSSHVFESVTIQSSTDNQHSLPDVVGVTIFAGKKTDVVNLNGGEANLPQNIGRMIFAKIPGVNLWDMDGAGTQMNIGTRGTDAHRSIEMNMRQNGYNTNSDVFGYPENHYTVPMQGVKQVQLVRGSAALQFGSQFGGMMNYVMKEGDTTKVFSFESEQTLGSNNFFNAYNAIGGKKGKVSYYAYYDNRHGDEWRANSAFNYKSYYASVKYEFTKRSNIAFQFSRMDYRQQIAGGLTDAQFQQDARQSERSRNYFSPKINVPAIIFNHHFSERTQLQITTNAVWGERSSVQFINSPNVADTFNTTIGSYNPRQVDRDFYSGMMAEARLLHYYSIGTLKSTLAAGVRYFNEHTKRRQKGKGTAGSNFDMSITAPYGIDLKFHTINYAVFAENIFQVSKKLSVTPGFRYEVIQSDLSGVINNASFSVNYKGKRTFPLFGVGLQYQISNTTQFYGNISQAYRPYLYASVTPADQLGIIDPHLKDSKGYDIDAGYRGHFSDLITFDVNSFYLFYGDKIDKLMMKDANNVNYLYTTNIGNAVAKGFEAYINFSVLSLFSGHKKNIDVRLFNSLAYTHARYLSARVNSGADNISIKGNHLENVPDWINRAGVELQHKGLTTTIQMSYTSKQFSDVNNTVYNASGVTGIIPSYTVWDWSLNWKFFKEYHVGAGINNIADARYFSRRINMYPGPGILPANGRTFNISLGLKI